MTFIASARLARRLPFLAIVSALATSSGSAAAQTAPAERKLGGMTVTADPIDDSYAPETATVASRTATPLIDVPQSVSVVTRQQIEDRNFFTVGEALQQVTGVTVIPFDGSNPDFRARGYTMDLAYDGIPATFSSGIEDFDLVIYDRVEVLRGPSGLFRGSGSPGGLVNFVRKRGQDHFEASGALSGGSYSNGRGEFDVGGPVDADGKLRLRAAGAYQDRRFFSHVGRDRKLTAYLAADYDLTPTTTLSASLTYQDDKFNSPYTGQPARADNGFLNLPRDTHFLPSWNLFTYKTTEYAAEIEQRFGKWSVRVRGLRREQDKLYMDSFVTPLTGVDPVTLTATYNRRRNQGDIDRNGIDAYASGPLHLFGRDHELTFGYNYEQLFSRSLFLNASRVPGVSVLNPEAIPLPLDPYRTGSEQRLTQSGFYGQARIEVLKPLTIVLGGRLSNYKTESRTVPPSVRTDYTVGLRSDNRFTPYGGAVLHLTPSMTVYASYADIFNPQFQTDASGAALPPRVGGQVEGGVKGRFFDGRLNASVAVFRTKDRNRAFLDPTYPAASNFYVPLGKVDVRGYEVEVTGSPLDGLDLTAGYSHLKTSYEKVQNPALVGTSFDLFEPEDLFKGYIRYRPKQLAGLFVAAGATAQSRVIGSGVAGLREQGPYAVANAQVGFAFSDSASINVQVNNLFDRVYYARVGSINVYNTFGDPRNVLVTLRGRF